MSALASVGSISLPTNNVAFSAGRRVKMSGGYLALAGDSDTDIGIVDRDTTTDDAYASVCPNEGQVVWMVAAGAFSQYASVYAAASGKVDDVSNSNPVGMALEAASGDGSRVRVLRYITADSYDNLGSMYGNVVIDEDFVGDWAAAATAFGGEGAYAWTKTETNGLGVTSSDQANGVLIHSFDAVAEAATATLFMENSPFDIDSGPIFECRFAVYDIGDDASLDIDVGMAADDHATDFEATNNYAAFHLNGNSLALLAHSDDGSTDTAETATGVTLVDNTFVTVKIDFTDKSDVTFWVDQEAGAGYVQVASGTTFDMSNYSSNLTPIVMVEKTSNDTTADVRVDRVRVQCTRA